MRKPVDVEDESFRLIDKHGKLHELVESTIIDIFRKFDMLLTRELTYVEFKGFFECIKKTITQQEFEKIKSEYNSTSKGLTQRGFIDFFRDSIQSYGEVILSYLLDLILLFINFMKKN